MVGETDLDRLVASMKPTLLPETFIFATGEDWSPEVWREAVMTFREREGVTAILPERAARKHGLSGIFRSRCITLDVHSSLEAVGFIAVVTQALAARGIGVNPVSAYYHDHLFVAADKAEEALEILTALASER